MKFYIIEELLKNIELPKMVKVKQIFSDHKINSIEDEISKEISKTEISDTIVCGKKIAVAVGSRGICNIARIVREVILNLKKLGAEPFVIPAMGSHGGATEKGQLEILNAMGVTEKYIGAPIKASMDVIQIGTTDTGLPAYIDKIAYSADGIVIINRIKPHTAFRGEAESGLLKMSVVGLGKQKGAEVFHSRGLKSMPENLIELSKVIFAKANILFGIAIVENAYDETCKIIAVPASEIKVKEPELLIEAKKNMPRIFFDKFDVLVVDEIGKNISGDGMDPNVTGRFYSYFPSEGPEIQRIVALDITEESHGNGIGLGMADFISERAFDKLDLEQMYVNVLTNNCIEPAKIPGIMPTNELALKAAIKTCLGINPKEAKIVRIKNTLSLKEIYISESLLMHAGKENFNILGEPCYLTFEDGV